MDWGMNLAAILIIILIGLILLKIILRITDRGLKKSTADPILYTFVRNVIKVAAAIVRRLPCAWAFWAFRSIRSWLLSEPPEQLLRWLSRTVLANIAGGVMIILTKPFSKDDLIDIGDVSGKVHHIDLFLTTLKTYDNKTITIPNGIVNTSVLVNHSQEEKRRVDCTFGIGYDDDIEHAKEIMRKVCDDNPLILTDPQPLIGVANHGESSVDMDLKAWCLTEHYWDVKYYLEEHIKVAFDENGIQIPFPQMDVHIHHE